MKISNSFDTESSLHENESAMSAKADASPPSPHDDNMGVDSATSSGYRMSAVQRAGLPSDYYYRLALDTLQVSLKGEWRRRSAVDRLLELRREAENGHLLGGKGRPIKDHNGKVLTVYPMGARPSYQVLIRGSGGLEIKLVSKADMPQIMIRFGARWCVELSLEEIRNWIEQFALHIQYELEEIALSEVHIRCDVPTPFTRIERAQLRGTCTRGGSFTEHFGANGLETLHNQGGKKPFKFVIYDKRYEQETKEGVLWPAIWKSYGIPETSPVWRVEGKWKRVALQERGLYRFQDLKEKTISGLWHHFTTQKLIIIDCNTDKRTSRAKADPLWAKVQSCGQLALIVPIKAKIRVTSTRLFKQGSGCIAKVLAVTGLGNFEDKIQEIIVSASDEGYDRFNSNHKYFLRNEIQIMLHRFVQTGVKAPYVRQMLKIFVEEGLKRQLIEEPFEHGIPDLNLYKTEEPNESRSQLELNTW